MKRILFIDFCNYKDYQIGGHLSFARSLMSAFGNQLSLVGISTDKKDPVGRWFKKEIDGTEYDFFALARYNKSKTKHIIPDRISCIFLLRYYKNRILKLNFQNVFVQRPEILPAIKDFSYKNICYCFPGTENPLKTSKYWFGRYGAVYFDKLFFSSLKDVKLILASADENAISSMVQRSKGILTRQSVIKFPTRINTDIYKPADKNEAREKLQISRLKKVVITVGRLSWLKGWKLMIDSFVLFEKKLPGSLFYFVGGGEDFNKINEYLNANSLNDKVILAGVKKPEEIAIYLNASDLYIMGSYKEGWSTSLMEAVACAIPVCVTNFSAASDIIQVGVNGYIESKWDVTEFASLMEKALALDIKEADVSGYSISNMKADLLRDWTLY
jgi:glycosyltransferase involved in cell wall biosynthesis